MRATIHEGDGDSRHGTENGYTNLRCRCELCRQAHADYFWSGAGREGQDRYRKHSGLLKKNYRAARDAGYSPAEARRRSHWSDPLRVEGIHE